MDKRSLAGTVHGVTRVGQDWVTFTFTELVKEAYNAGDSTPIHLREKLHRKMILTRGKCIDCLQEKGKPRGDVSPTVIEIIKKKKINKMSEKVRKHTGPRTQYLNYSSQMRTYCIWPNTENHQQTLTERATAACPPAKENWSQNEEMEWRCKDGRNVVNR